MPHIPGFSVEVNGSDLGHPSSLAKSVPDHPAFTPNSLRPFLLAHTKSVTLRRGSPMSSAPSMELAASPSAASGAQRPALIKQAAVLGAGTMGVRIAAHLANAGIPVVLLDLASGSGGVSIAEAALQALSR